MRHQIPLRTSGEARRAPLDCSGFKDVATDWHAYWIGFITADGNVFISEKENHARVQMGLKIEDADHLTKLLQGLDPTQKVKLYPKTSLARVWFSSPELVEALSQWGIVPRKTLMIAWPDTFPSNLIPAYIRGYFDGDGTLMKRRRVWRGAQRSEIVCRFTSGSIQFLEGLEQELQVRGIRTLKRYSNGPNTHVLPISGSRENLLAFSSLIYHESTIWLERKREIFREMEVNYG